MNKSNGKKSVRTGGANTYTIKGATLVEGYFPGAMRQNFRQNPDKILGKVNFGTFGNDQNYNGPGTIDQALPDGSKYQFNQILQVPSSRPNKLMAVDDRQLASYQVGQLHNNPLSMFTTNPDGPIPGLECQQNPDNYSTMVNRRGSEFNEYFNDSSPNNWEEENVSAINVYQQYTGRKTNTNSSVVYNMSLNTKEESNPFIAQGSSSVVTTSPEFSGKCYSGKFVPGKQIGGQFSKFNGFGDVGGQNPPSVYGKNKIEPKTVGEIGFMNPLANNNKTICESDRSLNFANPLVLNNITG
jgi:hypothetical protein